MRVQVRVEDEGAGLQGTQDLRDWLQRERIDGLEVKALPPHARPIDAMGLPPEVLELVAPGGVVAAIVSSLAAWMKVRRSDIKVRLARKGRIIELDAKNLKEEDIRAILKQFLSEDMDHDG